VTFLTATLLEHRRTAANRIDIVNSGNFRPHRTY
jgi:hypothetical protein